MGEELASPKTPSRIWLEVSAILTRPRIDIRQPAFCMGVFEDCDINGKPRDLDGRFSGSCIARGSSLPRPTGPTCRDCQSEMTLLHAQVAGFKTSTSQPSPPTMPRICTAIPLRSSHSHPFVHTRMLIRHVRRSESLKEHISYTRRLRETTTSS